MLILWVIGAYAAIGQIVGAADGDGILFGLIIATASISEFFFDWAFVLLFLAVCMMLFDRKAALNRHTEGRSGPVHVAAKVFVGVYALILFVFATATGGAQTSYLHDVFFADFTLHRRADIAKKFDTLNGLYYTFTALFIASAIFVIVYSVILIKSMRRAAVTDPVRTIYRHYPRHFALTCMPLGDESNGARRSSRLRASRSGNPHFHRCALACR
jgi:hypothetical protein